MIPVVHIIIILINLFVNVVAFAPSAAPPKCDVGSAYAMNLWK